MKKRGQVTIFVILGLILVLIIFLAIYLFRKPAETEQVTKPVPEEFKPVVGFVEQCIQTVTKDAVIRMGAHGGYIEPRSILLTPNQLTYVKSEPTRGDLANLGNNLLIPYYIHVPGKASYSNYVVSSAAPTLENMQLQIERFIEFDLPTCVGDFSSVKKSGFEVETSSELNAKVVIRAEYIDVFVTYPMNITKDSKKESFNNFKSKFNFPLAKYYSLALQITTAELSTQFTESFTKSLIQYYSGVDYSRLPPFLEYDNLPYIVTWSNSKVRSDLDSLLSSYVSAIQVENSKGFQPINATGDEVEDAFYASLSLPIFNGSVDNSINFIYLPNTLSSKVQPSKEDQIRPSISLKKGSRYIPESRGNTYKFYYDVSYPIFVEIRGLEPDSAIPEYSFVFALESNLIENKAPLAWEMGLGTVEWDESNINMTVKIPDGQDESGNTIQFQPRRHTKNLFCDEATWISGDYELELQNATGAPIEDATITYSCGDYAECWIGKSELVNNKAIWKGKLPICRGGLLTITKEGFGSKAIQLSTEEGVNNLISVVRLDKVKKVNISSEVVLLNKEFSRDEDWKWSAGADSVGGSRALQDEEQAIITISQVGLSAGSIPYSASAILGKDNDENAEIDLVPGEYEIHASLMDYNGVSIPAKCERECSKPGVLGIGCDEYTYFPEDKIELSPANWGGIEINDQTTGRFIVSSSNLESSDKLVIKIIRLPDLSLSNPPGACIIAIDEMSKVEEYSQKYRADLMPTFE